MRKIALALCFLLCVTNVVAFRISRPPKLTKKLDGNQLNQLNDFLENMWNLQQGEFNFDIVSSSKTNADNGDMWMLTPSIAEIQYKVDDAIFTLSPAVYGEIYHMGASFATTCTVAETYYQVAGFSSLGKYKNTKPSYVQNHITATVAGTYLVSFSVSASAAQADHYRFMVQYNNGTSDVMSLMGHRDVSVAARLGNIAASGIVELPKNATVELWVANMDTAARAIDIEHVTLNIVRLSP